MNWKEFFKPTIVKVIVLLILIFILPVFIETACKDYAEGGRCKSYPVTLYYFAFMQERTFEQMLRQHFFPSIIIDSILAYPISCLAISGYKKLIKK